MTTLSAFQSALATSGLNPVDIVCFGDSITEGMVSPHRENAWPQKLRDLLRAKTMSGSVRGGLGYAPSYSASSSLADFWTKIGSVEVSTLLTGLGQRMIKVPNGTGLTLGFTGTGLDVLYTTGVNSSFAYSLDGGRDIALDKRESGVNSGHVLSLRGLCEVPHTIVLKGTKTGSAFIEGGMIYRGDESAGVRMWEAGHSGAKASDVASSTAWQGSFRAVPAPKLIVIMYGTNEYQQAVPVATFVANLQAFLTMVTSIMSLKLCSVLVLSAHKRVPIDGFLDWSLYEDAISACATANGCAYLKMSAIIGDPAAAITAGLIESGVGTHPTTAGHALYASSIADLVTA